MFYLFQANNLPQVHLNASTIEVRIYETITIYVNCTDADGDDVTLELANDIPTATFNNGTGIFVWTPTDTTPVLIGYVYTFCLITTVANHNLNPEEFKCIKAF